MKQAIILSLAVLAAGCAPGSPQAMRDHPDRQKVFVVPADYETVYARIIEPLRAETTVAPLVMARMGVEGQLYAKRQAGTIAVWFSGMNGKLYPLLVDLRQVGPETTQVRICSVGIHGWRVKARRVEAWATGSR